MWSGQQDATDHSKIVSSGRAEDDEDEDEPVSRGRPRRAAQQNRVKAKPPSRKHTEGYDSLGSMDDESDATSSGNEWDGGDEDEPDDHVDDEEEDEDVDMSDDSVAEEEEGDPRQSLVVSLRYTKSHRSPPSQDTRNGPAHGIPQMTTSNSMGPSETACPPLHHAALTGHVVPVQYAAPTDPRSQIGHSGQATLVAPEKDHTSYHLKNSQPEEHQTPKTSWPRPETRVVPLNGTQM